MSLFYPCTWGVSVTTDALLLGPHLNSMKKQEDLLSDWLLQARKWPLSITIAICEENDLQWDDPPAHNSVLSLMLVHSEQWCSTDINIPNTLLHLLPDWLNVPILEHLTLRCDLKDYPDFPVVLHVPWLHSVTLIGLCQMDPVILPWDQVKTLHIEGYGMQYYLKQCPNLVNLMLNEQDCRGHKSTTPLMVIKLDSLKSLHVIAHGKNCFMLDRLSTPHLSDFDMFSLILTKILSTPSGPSSSARAVWKL